MNPRSFLFKPVAGVLTALSIFLLLELILRAGAFVWHDFSPYYLFYGVHSLAGRAGVSAWHTSGGRYYKFPPNYRVQGAVGQAGEVAAINSAGFRGPDFQRPKPPGAFRIVCLGESSTFGFHNRDDETYPFLLQQLWQGQPGPVRVEVINAGFPYYTSGSILSLLREEVLALEPDLLTVYSAYNDAGWPLDEGAATRLASWLHAHSMTYFLMKEVMSADRVVRWRRRMVGRVRRRKVDRDGFDAHVSRLVARYRANYEAMLALARSRGIPVILIKQPMTARYGHIQRLQYAKSYEEEYREVRRKLDTIGELSSVEYQMLVHHHLVEELEAIALRHGTPLVDNIAVLDRDRRLMASYVHLTEEANRRLANALRPVIDRYLPSQLRITAVGKADGKESH